MVVPARTEAATHRGRMRMGAKLAAAFDVISAWTNEREGGPLTDWDGVALGDFGVVNGDGGSRDGSRGGSRYGSHGGGGVWGYTKAGGMYLIIF